MSNNNNGPLILWRTALVGLTPKVIAIVAVLLLIRALSTKVEQIIFAANSRELECLALLFDIVLAPPRRRSVQSRELGASTT